MPPPLPKYTRLRGLQSAVAIAILAGTNISLFAQSSKTWNAYDTAKGIAETVSVSPDTPWSFSQNETSTSNLNTYGYLTNVSSLEELVVKRIEGKGGVIAISRSASENLFVAVQWNSSSQIEVTYKLTKEASEQAFEVNIEVADSLKLTRRGALFYFHAEKEGHDIPLVAVEFGSPHHEHWAGVIGDGTFTCHPATVGILNATQNLTVDVVKGMPGIEVSGHWETAHDAKSIQGTHLTTQGKLEGEVASVELNGVLPGEHDLWIRYVVDDTRSDSIDLSIEGAEEPALFEFGQKCGGQLWIALGRYATSTPESTLKIGLTVKTPGSGSVSLDGIHYLWASWKDDDHDGVPDVIEDASRSFAASDWKELLKSSSVYSSEGALKALANGKGAKSSNSVDNEGGTVVFHADSKSGSDANDGTSSRVLPGAWNGVQRGPKRTLQDLFTTLKTKNTFELNLNGVFDVYVGGLNTHPEAGTTINPGPEGATFNPILPLPKE